MRQTSSKYQLLQHRLGRDLAAWVAEHYDRREGGWRRLAADLSAITGITVSHETLRAWFAPREDSKPAGTEVSA